MPKVIEMKFSRNTKKVLPHERKRMMIAGIFSISWLMAFSASPASIESASIVAA
jgi:hypothetical protein